MFTITADTKKGNVVYFIEASRRFGFFHVKQDNALLTDTTKITECNSIVSTASARNILNFSEFEADYEAAKKFARQLDAVTQHIIGVLKANRQTGGVGMVKGAASLAGADFHNLLAED